MHSQIVKFRVCTSHFCPFPLQGVMSFPLLSSLPSLIPPNKQTHPQENGTKIARTILDTFSPTGSELYRSRRRYFTTPPQTSNIRHRSVPSIHMTSYLEGSQPFEGMGPEGNVVAQDSRFGRHESAHAPTQASLERVDLFLVAKFIPYR